MALPRLPRLSTFDRIQLLLVLWAAAASILQGGLGVSFPGASVPGVPALSWALLGGALLRATSVAMYPLLAFVMSRRAPLWGGSRRSIAWHAGTIAALHCAAFLCGELAAWIGRPAAYGWSFYLHTTFEYAVYAVFAHGMQYGERFHEKEREELRLRAEMADSTAARAGAQVRALRMEWSPHFLTGTLEAIGALLSRDVAAAKRMLLGLSSVLRRVLAHARIEAVRLEKEVELVEEVLRVEALRRTGLVVEREIDEAALDLPVPHMALLTMVFQALQGCRADAPLRLAISAAPDESGVLLRVDAFGEPAEQPPAATAHAFRQTSVGDSVRLELRCASEAPADAAPVRRAAISAPAAPIPAVGRGLEAGTYATLILSYTLLALFAAWTRVESGSIALAGPAWLYVGGAAFYAALWWGSFVAAARWLSARYPIRQASWRRGVAMHAAGALLVAILNGIAYFPYQWYAVEGGSVVLGIASHWAWGDLAVYPTLAGIAHGFIYAREYHAKRLSELRLRSLLAESELQRTEAELQALKAELNPHFLFNALNTVSSLMHTRVDDARRVVAHLSALLRRVLESGSLQEVSVEEEVEFIRLYLEIEQARFGDALRIVYRLDPATLRARVPHLLIQPLVENAVKHGLRPRDGTGQVMLSSERVGDFLQLMVADDGVGPGHTPRAEGTGTGLANVRQRLRQLYGEHQSFELAPAPSGGATASIRIPFTEHPRTAPA
jgi:LytS/YehU family sensor histidine kinase